MILQSFKMAWKSIGGNKLRSFLTMLGIAIGVAALVALVSLTGGTAQSVTDQISSLGANMLTVSISDDKGKPLKLQDLQEFEDLDAVGDAVPVAQASVTSAYGGNSETAAVYGTCGGYLDIRNLTLASGRFLKSPDVENHTSTAVISADLAKDLVGTSQAVGETVRLGGMPYLVIGVLEEQDGSSGTYSSYEAYIPFTSLVRLSDSVPSDVTRFCVSAADVKDGETDGKEMEKAEKQVEQALLARYGNDTDAFSIMNQSEIMEAMGNVSETMSLLLGGIAAISLLVGGIGIMNIMLVSVTERTREIGIRKAIGAGRGTIMLQFLLEALIVSLLGCLAGVGISWGIVRGISVIAAENGSDFQLSMGAVCAAVLFSAAAGIVFGLYPASKAAKKNPIEALRYTG